jgi:hypothetical protein
MVGYRLVSVSQGAYPHAEDWARQRQPMIRLLDDPAEDRAVVAVYRPTSGTGPLAWVMSEGWPELAGTAK